MLTDVNYHRRHQSITVLEAEHHIDHNHEITITHRMIKETKTLTIITTEIQVTIEITITEAEQTATTEAMIITVETTVGRIQDITVKQDHNHHIITIITEVTIKLIIMIDRGTIVEIQVEEITTEIDQSAIVGIIQITTAQILIVTMLEKTDEIHQIENTITEIDHKIADRMDINITIITTKIE